MDERWQVSTGDIVALIMGWDVICLGCAVCCCVVTSDQCTSGTSSRQCRDTHEASTLTAFLVRPRRGAIPKVWKREGEAVGPRRKGVRTRCQWVLVILGISLQASFGVGGACTGVGHACHGGHPCRCVVKVWTLHGSKS